MNVNQIVKGKKAGTFVILGFFKQSDGEKWAQLKAVDPQDHSRFGAGELALPVSVLETI